MEVAYMTFQFAFIVLHFLSLNKSLAWLKCGTSQTKYIGGDVKRFYVYRVKKVIFFLNSQDLVLYLWLLEFQLTANANFWPLAAGSVGLAEGDRTVCMLESSHIQTKLAVAVREHSGFVSVST